MVTRQEAREQKGKAFLRSRGVDVITSTLWAEDYLSDRMGTVTFRKYKTGKVITVTVPPHDLVEDEYSAVATTLHDAVTAVKKDIDRHLKFRNVRR